MVKAIYGMSVTTAFVVASCIGVAAYGQGSGTKPKEVKGTFEGTIEIKSERVDGRLREVPYLKVTQAKDDKGKSLAKIKGTSLKVVGAKRDEVATLAGKELRIDGKLRENKEIAIESYTVKDSDKEGSNTKEKTKGAREGSDTK